MTISLRVDERWAYVGKTGSGKSYLARYNLKKIAAKGWPIVIVDSPDHFWLKEKDTKDFARRGPGTIDIPYLTDGRLLDKQVQIYQPESPGYADDDLLSLLEHIYDKRNMLVYFDELYGIVDANHQPDIFLRLWAQGRKINVGAWCATQRPARIPEIVLSQAENMAIFRMTNINDRKRMAEYTSTPDIQRKALTQRYWYYWNQESDVATLMKPIGG